MPDAPPSPPAAAPQGPRELARHLALAGGVAAAVFLAFVLPAEYGVDPTGLGDATGVSRIFSPDPAPEAAGAQAAPLAQRAWREDVHDIVVPAGKGIEFKFIMNRSEALVYTWSTAPPTPLFHDLHGEPAAGPPGYFESYRTASASAAQGALVAPFDGTHGWFWENVGTAPVTVTLQSKGFYDVKGVVEA